MGSSPAFLMPASLGFQCLLAWREKWRGPAWPCCATLSVSTAGSRGRCQDRAVCVKWMQLGWAWAELDTGMSFQSVWQGNSHHAELRGHQCGVCSRSERVSLAVLETCPSVQEPLWGHSPAPLGSGSLHSLHTILKRPVHSPVLYQAKMQELNEFLKLVLVSAFFFNFPSRQGG